MYVYIPPVDPDKRYNGLTSQSIGYRLTTPDLREMQEAVGGLVLPVELGIDGISAYVNDEGKYTEMPNHLATLIAHRCRALLPGDWIAGTMLIVGFNAVAGETTDLPQWLQSAQAVHGLGRGSGDSNYLDRMPDMQALYEDYRYLHMPDDAPLRESR